MNEAGKFVNPPASVHSTQARAHGGSFLALPRRYRIDRSRRKCAGRITHKHTHTVTGTQKRRKREIRIRKPGEKQKQNNNTAPTPVPGEMFFLRLLGFAQLVGLVAGLAFCWLTGDRRTASPSYPGPGLIRSSCGQGEQC